MSSSHEMFVKKKIAGFGGGGYRRISLRIFFLLLLFGSLDANSGPGITKQPLPSPSSLRCVRAPSFLSREDSSLFFTRRLASNCACVAPARQCEAHVMNMQAPDARYGGGAPLFFLGFRNFGSLRPLPKTDLRRKIKRLFVLPDRQSYVA